MPQDLIQSPGTKLLSSSHYQSQESPAPLTEDMTGSSGLPELPKRTFPEAARHLQGECHQRGTHKDIQQLVSVVTTHEDGQSSLEDNFPYGSIFLSFVVKDHVAIDEASNVGMQGEGRRNCFFGT